MPIPSHHVVGDTGHAADHNAIVDTLTTHDQSITTLQGVTVGLFYISGNNTSNLTGTTNWWAKVVVPSGNRDSAADIFSLFQNTKKTTWFNGYGEARFSAADPTHVPVIVSPYDNTQSGDLQQWKDSTGTTLAKVDKSGNITGANTEWGPWTNITLQSGIVWYQHSTHTPQYRVKGDVVQLRGVCGKSNGTDFTSSPVTLGTLPAGARPTGLVYNAVARQVSSNTMVARLEVASTGSITVYTDTSNSAAWISLDNTQFSTLAD
jgi:hypothetical protein